MELGTRSTWKFPSQVLRFTQVYVCFEGAHAVKQAFKALIGRKFIDPTIENRGEVPAKEQQVHNIWFDNRDYFQILVQYWGTTEEKPQVQAIWK